MFFFFIGNDHVSGVPKAAKNNQNCTSSKLSITTRLYCIYLTITGTVQQVFIQIQNVYWIKHRRYWRNPSNSTQKTMS